MDERTGAADLEMDPGNPLKLVAAMWDYRRWPWFFRSGGPGSGIFITHDGGRTWTKRTHHDGLPRGDLGRCGLAIAPSDPETIYVLVEAEEIALYKSVDGGVTFRRSSTDRSVGNRPFYYADLRVDPKDPNRVYSLWSNVSLSTDGGRTFEILGGYGGGVHPDHHALWIDPEDPKHMISGNDGGIYISHDHGNTWWFARNLPLGQYYHVRVDLDVPYHVYGGMQDNGSWRGPSSVWQDGGIRNFHWRELYYGDGFDTLPDPADSMQGYAMSQEGHLGRWNLRTGVTQEIRPVGPEGVKLRFNWNAGIAQDPFRGGTIYFGSQFVHRSDDRGDTWRIISPDLTTNNPEWQKQDESGGLTLDVTGAENFTTITAIAPSPLADGLLWVGTDDGRLHVTRDGGEAWTSVENNLPGVPEHTWIPHVAPSPHDPETCFVVLENHRRSDWTPYVFRTRDLGKTFTSLATDDLWGYALVIEQDPVNPELLYLGTEFGLYLSLNGGKGWFRWTHGVPTVSVMDLTIHPREHDLVLGTHGRSAFIIDDASPLREVAGAKGKPLHLFDVAPAVQYTSSRAPSTRSAGTAVFRGENRPYGALITFWVEGDDLPHPDPAKERTRQDRIGGKEGEAPKAKIEIKDGDGNPVRVFETPVTRGLNRTVWPLRRDAFKNASGGGRRGGRRGGAGPEVLPGDYRVKVAFGDHTAETAVTVLPDPRVQISSADRRAKYEAILAAGRLQERAAEAMKRITQVKEDLDLVIARLGDTGNAAVSDETGKASDREDSGTPLLDRAKALKASLDAIERRFRVSSDKQDIPPGRGVLRDIRGAYRGLSATKAAPTEAQYLKLQRAEAALDAVIEILNDYLEKQVGPFRKALCERGVPLFRTAEPMKKPEKD